METSLALAIIDEVVPKGIKYSATYLVEFNPDSPWFEASLTVAAGALKNGVRTEFHTYMHPPSEVRDSLVKLGLHPKNLEESDHLRILDTYDVMTGLAHPETPSGMRSKGREPFEHQSFDINHWSERVVKIIRDGVAEDEKRWLHVDDNTSVINNYAEEKSILDVWRTRVIPYAKVRELAMFHSVMTGIASDSFYKQFESLCDGIIDFRSGEEDGRIQHYARVRTIRGMHCDTRWRRLRLRNDGSVMIDQSEKPKEFGISAWLKGPGT